MQKVNYIHLNSVRAEVGSGATEYRWSSARIWQRCPLEDEPCPSVRDRGPRGKLGVFERREPWRLFFFTASTARGTVTVNSCEQYPPSRSASRAYAV
jgi:hypothetical protein